MGGSRSPTFFGRTMSLDEPLFVQDILATKPLCFVPKWMLNENVSAFIQPHYEKNHDLDLPCFVGPAVQRVRVVLVVFWSFFLVFPFIAYWSIDCPAADEQFPSYPKWLFAIVAPVMIF